MPFDWREYLELAKSLGGQAGVSYSSEAAERSAVSRAYYSAFCLVRNYAQANLWFQGTKTPDDHKNLREHLKRQGKTQLASHLSKLRVWRNACDYDDEVPNLAYCVQNAIKIAEKAIQECS
ncbi:MAG: hypothetical protein D6687_09470 [Acidobacteria bacterium]|nr:MAG: hypothetical protein D6687_09470 [Acidobacteriota bacterium]